MNEFRYRYDSAITYDGILIELRLFKVVKKTPAGAWCQMFYDGYLYGKKFFVLDGNGKRKCHETKEMAWNSFKIRKRRYKERLELRLAETKLVLKNIDIDTPEDSVIIKDDDIILHFNLSFD